MGAGGSAYQNRLAKYAYGRSRNQKVLPSVDAELTYGKLLIIAAGADGKVADKERKWIVESRAALGAPGNVVSALQKYNPTKEQAAEFISKEQDFIEPMKRALVYDCCEMAGADGGFSQKERAVVTSFATRLALDHGVAEQIIKAYDEDNEAKKKRSALLFPRGVDTAIQSACDEKAKKVGRAA